ncbi:MAG: hypothetical protein CMM01_00870 [Rhodopirellula sp.]|nr:hypothetical protein [Rhodopirellula sp.]OUX52639.1 MAG: hypothetical protein CBE43_00235 [Rhodopirellula sp. TMED283]
MGGLVAAWLGGIWDAATLPASIDRQSVTLTHLQPLVWSKPIANVTLSVGLGETAPRSDSS